MAASLAFALLALQQPQDLIKHARALAKEDAQARATAEAYVDAVPMLYLGHARSVAAQEAPEVRDALLRRLPHPFWRGVMDGTFGEVRRRERELLGETPTWTSAALSRAAARLLEGSRADRVAGLRLLARVPAPDPAALLPAMDDPATAGLAAAAIGRADGALALKEALRRFREGPEAVARQMSAALAERGSPELTPILAEMLRANHARAADVVILLEKFGDARAEEALIEWLLRAPSGLVYGALRTLSQLGGPKAAAAIRRFRDGLGEDDANRAWATEALATLREPGLSRELLASSPWDKTLLRLGDRGILEEVVARIRAGGLKIRDRNVALELLGLLGGEAHVDLLLEHLKDDRFKESAAAALRDIGDPRAARPLVEALTTSWYGLPYVRALEGLPLTDAEATLLEALEDPEGSPGSFPDLIALAGRAGGSKLKERLSALVVEGAWSASWAAAWTLGPMLTPEERNTLRARTGKGLAMALALAGDEASVAACVRAWREGRLTMPRGANAEDPPLPASWAGAIEAEFKKAPEWFEGALWLARRGRPAGRELLLQRAAGREAKKSIVALAALGDTAALLRSLDAGDLPHWTPQEEAVVTKAVDGPVADRLRLWAWMMIDHSPSWPARALAARRDASMEALFLRALRRHHLDNDVEQYSDIPAFAEAVGPEARVTFLRLLRSRAPSARVLGARSLARLDGREALPHLIPLLDDGEAFLAGGRVRDRVVDVLEGLAGRAFQGSPRARVEAARAWCAK